MKRFLTLLICLLPLHHLADARPHGGGSGGGGGTLYTLPAARTVQYMPGLSYAPTSGPYAPTQSPSGWTGGIPTNYTQSGSTLTASGGDDTTAINNAITTACGTASQSGGKYVQLAAGHFKTSSAINIHCSYVALVGVGAGPGVKGALNTAAYMTANAGSATIIENTTNTASQIVQIGIQLGGPSTSLNSMYETSASTGDMVAGTNTTTLSSPASVSGMAVGEIVYVDELWDPNISWINQFAGQGNGYYGWGEATGAGSFPLTDQTSSRPVGQAMEVASFNSGTGVVTFTTPFAQTYRASHSAHLGRINPGTRVQWSGISKIFMTGPTGGTGSPALWGDGWSKVTMASCSYCWAQNIEISGHGQQASALVEMLNSFRCEVRDSYLHGDSVDIVNVEPGGSYYNFEIDTFTSDSLIENNISWIANKVIVMRTGGSGNVVAYNYMDDGYGYGYVSEMETGINQNHMVGTHQTLFEGNYSWMMATESRWGNTNGAIFFRNWASGMRVSAWPSTLITPYPSSCATGNPLIGLVYNQGGGDTSYYEDAWTRNPIKDGSWTRNFSFVGNVLGYPGNPLLTSPQSTGAFNSGPQTGFTYEIVGASIGTNVNPPTVPIWTIGDPGGSNEATNVNVTAAISGTALTITVHPGASGMLVYPAEQITTGAAAGTTISSFIGSAFGETGQYTITPSQTVSSRSMVIGYWGNDFEAGVLPNTLRDANYDYFTGQVHWHGIGGTGVGQTTPPGASASGGSVLPNSMYQTSKPAFFHSATWPWVDGSNATTPIPGTLPAMTRFQSCTPNSV